MRVRNWSGNRLRSSFQNAFALAHATHVKHYGVQPAARPMGMGLELYGRRKDGSEFPVDIVLSPLQVDGETLSLAMVRDITERKRIETALQKSEESFRVLVDGVNDYAIFMLDPSGRVVTWNSGAERIKGYRAAEIVGEHFSWFYSPEDIESGKPEQRLKIAASEGRLEDEGWRVRKDGSRFWANVIITPVRDKNGELSGICKSHARFYGTQEMRSNWHSNSANSVFATLFDFSPDAILATNKSGDITEANSQVEKFFGYSQSRIVGPAD